MPAFDEHALLRCYARGVFPMADGRDDDEVFLVDPQKRGVLPLTGFRVSRRLARRIRSEPFDVRVDTAFHDVLRACAASRPGRTETWINHPIESLYLRLHRIGHAHSLECWQDDELVGGLYGVSLGGAFFGESMFSRRTDASKVALAHLVARLIAGGYRLLDAQFITDHLMQFGAEEIDRAEYHRRLVEALAVEADFYGLDGGGGATGSGGFAAGAGIGAGRATALGFGVGTGLGGATGGVSGREVLQLITQAS